MPNGADGRIVLYERPGCHLCEDAAVLLDDMLGPEAYTRTNIETDDDLLVRYGHRIPVVAIDDTDRLDLTITAPDLRAVLREAGLG
jgi:hypothetical protein